MFFLLPLQTRLVSNSGVRITPQDDWTQFQEFVLVLDCETAFHARQRAVRPQIQVGLCLYYQNK